MESGGGAKLSMSSRDKGKRTRGLSSMESGGGANLSMSAREKGRGRTGGTSSIESGGGASLSMSPRDNGMGERSGGFSAVDAEFLDILLSKVCSDLSAEGSLSTTGVGVCRASPWMTEERVEGVRGACCL